jgi:phosphoribosylformylglycinamidine synthase
VPCADDAARDVVLLFSESPSRFLLEVQPEHLRVLADLFWDLPLGRIGEVTGPAPDAPDPRVTINGLNGLTVIDASVRDLKESWQHPLRW